MKKGAPTRAIVGLDARRHVVETKRHPETPFSSLMKKKRSLFLSSLYQFHNSGCNNITIPHATDSTSVMLSQPSQRQHSVATPAKLPLLTVPDKQEELLKLTYAEI